MPHYKVRPGFYVHHNGTVLSPGAIAAMDEMEAGRYAHQLEQIEIEVKPNVTTRNRRKPSPVSTPGSEDGDN